MSEQLKDKCPICGAYLFDDDDIVYCPECGAPHHRDCYKSIGHCGLEEFHGTEKQYKKPGEQEQSKQSGSICPRCHKELPEQTHFCPYCGMAQGNNTGENEPEFNAPFSVFHIGPGGQIAMPDPYGGVEKNSEIDGVKVTDIAKFISYAPNKYLPKFKRFADIKTKTSWNIAAFLAPYAQALFRKMYMPFILYTLLEFTVYVLLAPFFNSVMNMNMPVDTTTMQIVDELMRNPSKYLSPQVTVLAVFAVVLFFAVRIFAGLFNDFMYKNHTINSIKKIREDEEADDEYEFYKKGGVRPFLSLGIVMVEIYFGTYIPIFLAGLLFG